MFDFVQFKLLKKKKKMPHTLIQRIQDATIYSVGIHKRSEIEFCLLSDIPVEHVTSYTLNTVSMSSSPSNTTLFTNKNLINLS